jgi:hypothetical protein
MLGVAIVFAGLVVNLQGARLRERLARASKRDAASVERPRRV